MSRKQKNHRGAESALKTSGPLPMIPHNTTVASEFPKTASPKSASPSTASPDSGSDPQGMSWQLVFLVIVMGLGIIGLVAKSLKLF